MIGEAFFRQSGYAMKMGSPGITWGFFIGWFEGGGKKTELLE
jgi:hypothetical protein